MRRRSTGPSTAKTWLEKSWLEVSVRVHSLQSAVNLCSECPAERIEQGFGPRSGMARPRLPDDLRDEIAPLLPSPRPRPRGGRPAIDNRAVHSGPPWEMRPAEMGCGGWMRCWRLRDRQAVGAWGRLHQVLLERRHAAGHRDWSRASLDSASVPAKKAPCHRPEPDGPGQAGDQAPGRHRCARHAPRPDADRRQPPRQRDAGPTLGAPCARDHAADRSARDREPPEARASSMGGGADPRLVQPRPPSARALRAPRRHLRVRHEPGCKPHQPSTRSDGSVRPSRLREPP